jgi:predicted MFS family arabinose efflux permease
MLTPTLSAAPHPPRAATITLLAFFTLVDLFAAQAILPTLARMYHVGPGEVGVAVNATTAGMALGALLTALFGAKIDRRAGIVGSLFLLTAPSALLAVAPNLIAFTILRVAQGLCMACAFTLTLSFLGDTTAPSRQGGAFAAYITGNVASNLVGRLISAWTAGMFGASATFLVFAALNLLGAALALMSVREVPGGRAAPMAAPSLRAALTPRLLAGYGVGFCILFAFIGVFSYVNFLLMRPPFGLGMMSLGAVYFVFAPSIVATPLAGPAAARFGGRATLLAGLAVALTGLWLLASPHILAVICGLVLVGLGTFFAQATATGQVSSSAAAARRAASGLYLAAYFAGGLAGAAALGATFEAWGWVACLRFVAASLALCAALGLSFPAVRPASPLNPVRA